MLSCHLSCSRLFLVLYWPRSELSATFYVPHTMTMPTEKSQRYTMLFFCTPQKSAKWLEQKWSSNTAPPLVTRGGYVVGWCRTNHSIRIPPLQLYENGNFDLAITLLMLYTPNFEVYLSKLHIAPSSLGLSCYGKRLVVIAYVQWNWVVTENQ